MSYPIIKLRFQGPLHLSKGKESYETGDDILHSDTIKSALFAVAVQLDGRIASEGDTNAFMDSFQVSSAFPFYKTEYFFPKPASKFFHIYDKFDRKIKKAEKKLKFVGKSYFEDLISGQNICSKRIYKDCHFIESTMVSESIEITDLKAPDFYIMHRDTVMRVNVPRYPTAEAEPEPYYLERTFFSPDGGLYFFINWPKDDKTKKLLEEALHILGENGLGMDRNTGNGQFEWEKADLELKTPAQSTHRILMSLYCPGSPKEVTPDILEKSAYALIKRGGYISNGANEKTLSYRKKSVFMMTEGSVLFGSAEGDFPGKLLDLQPDIMKEEHQIWREGRPFTLPCNPIF